MRPHGLQPTRLLCPWDFPGKSTGMGCYCLLHPYMTTGKTISLTRWTFVGKVMSLLLNMLSRLVITFLLRSKHLLISCLQSPSAVILEPRKIKPATVSTVSPSICHEVRGPMPWSSFSECWALSQLFHSPLWLSSAYLRLLIFLPAILIPACASFSPAFLMMYST